MIAAKSLAALGVVLAAGAIGVSATSSAGVPQWRKALEVRSEALNRQYGLGEQARMPAASAEPQWLLALMARSDALNEKYGLGEYPRKPASTADPEWLRALMVRSEALNQQYQLGKYAPGS